MSGQYGVTFSTWANRATTPDLDPFFSLDKTTRGLAEDLFRGWLTPNGSLSWARSDGQDLREMLSARITADELELRRVSMEQDALEDDRVLSCSVTLTFENKTLSFEADIVGTDGESFRFIGEVSATKSELINVGKS